MDEIYTGFSMAPDFRDGDLLITCPVPFREIRRGDVICFCPPGTKRRVVHRVCSVSDSGVRTRGDHNIAADRWLLTEADAPVLVTALRRDGRRIPVVGGVAGCRRALRVRLVRIGCRTIGFPLRVLLEHLPERCFPFRAEGLTLYRFRDDEIRFAGTRPVAHRRRGGAWRFLSGADRFRYKRSALERRFPPRPEARCDE